MRASLRLFALSLLAAGSILAPAIPSPAMAQELSDEGRMPSLSGATHWFNSPPLTTQALRGKVVLVDFWTYSCINCLREMPYIRAWAEKYKNSGLVVIGVHAPEFEFEKKTDNIQKAISRFHVDFPVAVDNDRSIWNGFNNEYWPAAYFIDAQGRIRHHHFGEGGYATSERIIQTLLTEAGAKNVPTSLVNVSASGEQAEADMNNVGSPETYIGYARARNFISTGGAVQDSANDYVLQGTPELNQWGVTGNWTVTDEHATLNAQGGGITYRFHARDLHLVMGPGPNGKPIRFRVTIDGRTPGMQHGTDIDEQGNGTVTSQRLYQLVRQTGPITDHTFHIEFLDPGVQAFAFTFG
ncbi:thioredoxin family protein [Kozakia baliensis]|uniref:thioredoxin family protein n=1 Tax=Kozakia baliensis TaxID=153496 RepID=UPI00345B5A7D